MRAELLIFEQAAGEPASAVGNHDHVGLRHALQASGKVGRVAHDRRFQRGARADHVSNDHQAGRDADPRAQRPGRTSDGIEPPDRFDDREARTHRSFGIVLMRVGIAEIDQYAVAEIAGDETAEPRRQSGDAGMIRRDDLAQIFGIKPATKPGRVDEVGEHHRKLAALRCRRLRLSRSGLALAGGFDRLRGGPAVGTEAFVRWILAAAIATLPGQRRTTVAAELPGICNAHTTAWAVHATFSFGRPFRTSSSNGSAAPPCALALEEERPLHFGIRRATNPLVSAMAHRAEAPSHCVRSALWPHTPIGTHHVPTSAVIWTWQCVNANSGKAL